MISSNTTEKPYLYMNKKLQELSAGEATDPGGVLPLHHLHQSHQVLLYVQ